MKTNLLVLIALFTLTAASLQAADKVTLTGTALCAKCTLHETDVCQNVLEVKTAEGKAERYYFTNKMDHEKFCKKDGCLFADRCDAMRFGLIDDRSCAEGQQ